MQEDFRAPEVIKPLSKKVEPQQQKKNIPAGAGEPRPKTQEARNKGTNQQRPGVAAGNPKLPNPPPPVKPARPPQPVPPFTMKIEQPPSPPPVKSAPPSPLPKKNPPPPVKPEAPPPRPVPGVVPPFTMKVEQPPLPPTVKPEPPPPLPKKKSPPLPKKQPQKVPSKKRDWMTVSIVGILLLIGVAVFIQKLQPPPIWDASLAPMQAAASGELNSRPADALAGTPSPSESETQMISEASASATDSASSSGTETPEISEPLPPEEPPPPPTGELRLSAVAVDANGKQHPITGEVMIDLSYSDTSFTIVTNVAIPHVWCNMPVGDYGLFLETAGYRPSSNTPITVLADVTNEMTVVLQPLRSRVQFGFPVTNVVFDVYNDTRLLGTSKTAYDLTPFVPHYLTFKADGWRDNRVNVQLAKPGTSYRMPIGMERIEAKLHVSVATWQSDPPTLTDCPAHTVGWLAKNGENPVEVEFPLEGAFHMSGPMTLTLTMGDYRVLDSTQQVVLVDRQTAYVVFVVDRKSWVSRMLSPSTRRPNKE